jgi:hypothetical protein
VQFFHALPADLDLAFVLAGLRKVVTRLHAHPRLRCAAERLRKPDSHFGTYARLAINDFCKGLPGHSENLCTSSHGKAQRFKAGVFYDAPGMGGVFHGHGVWSLS